VWVVVALGQLRKTQAEATVATLCFQLLQAQRVVEVAEETLLEKLAALAVAADTTHLLREMVEPEPPIKATRAEQAE
jgi:hypothetical protein